MKYDYQNVFMLLMLISCLSISCSSQACDKEPKSGKIAKRNFEEKFQKFHDEMDVFPIDMLIMPGYKSTYYLRQKVSKNPITRKWSYEPFRWDLGEKRLNLWYDFNIFATNCDRDDFRACESLAKNSDPKSRALALSILFISADPEYLELFFRHRKDTEIAFEAIVISDAEKKEYVKYMLKRLGRPLNDDDIYHINGVSNGYDSSLWVIASFYFENERIICEHSENSSDKPKTVADFANGFLWFWYHYDYDRKIEPRKFEGQVPNISFFNTPSDRFFFDKFIEDDRTIPVFPEKKYEELKERLSREDHSFTRISIRQSALLNSPPKTRDTLYENMRRFIRTLPEESHFHLQYPSNGGPGE